MNRRERRAEAWTRARGFEVIRAPLTELDPKTKKVVVISETPSLHTIYLNPRKYDARGQAIGKRSKRTEYIPPTIPAEEMDPSTKSSDPL